jgi:hypothetical protein
MPVQSNENQEIQHSWMSRLKVDIQNISDDLEKKVPWLDLLPVPEKFSSLNELDTIMSPLEMQLYLQGLGEKIKRLHQEEIDSYEIEWLEKLEVRISTGLENIEDYLLLLNNITNQCETMSEVSYDFLFNKSTSLLSIGYNVTDYRLDPGYYDLMASEARLGIFVAIAQGKLPQKSWFVLGRLLTGNERDPILLSWSGSMFEYLMPQLVMPVYENTLLYQTGVSTIKKQICYA